MNTPQRYRIGHYSKNDEGKLDLAIHHDDFPNDCFAELQKETEVIFELQPIIMLHEAVKNNYSEINETISQCATFFGEVTPQKGMAYHTINHLVVLSQRITNFLSSASAFLTSSEIKLGKVFGVESKELSEWNDYRRNLHKNSFSYRFAYELRNYSQHSNLPLSALSVNVDKKSGNTAVLLNVYRDDLLESGFKWKKLSADIKKENITFDLLPYLNEYMLVLNKLMTKYFGVNERKIANCAYYINMLNELFNFPNDAVPVLYKGNTPEGSPVPESFDHIPIEQLMWVLEKRKQLEDLLNSMA